MTYQVISLIPEWYSYPDNPNMAAYDGDGFEDALRARLDDVAAPTSFSGTFVVVGVDEAAMFAVSSYAGYHSIKTIKFGLN